MFIYVFCIPDISNNFATVKKEKEAFPVRTKTGELLKFFIYEIVIMSLGYVIFIKNAW